MSPFALFSSNKSAETDAERHIVQLVQHGNFIEVSKETCFRELNDSLRSNKLCQWSIYIEEYLGNRNSLVELQAFGAAALLLFIQENWTGPPICCEAFLNCDNDGEEVRDFNDEAGKLLALDGEGIPVTIRHPWLLYLSLTVSRICCTQFPTSKLCKVWQLRSLHIHQIILEETSPVLFGQLNGLMEDLNGNEYETGMCLKEQKAALGVECAQVYLHYGYVQKAHQELLAAMQCLGMETFLTGALGKRTRFQQKDLPQLTFKVTLTGSGTKESEVAFPVPVMCPVDLSLNDEVRLERIKYENDTEGTHPDLNGLQQALILCLMRYTLKSQARDGMLEEEVLPMVQCVLNKPAVWGLQFTALLERSQIEATNKRTVERSMMQTQALVDCLEASEPPVSSRLALFFLGYQRPKWKVQSILADIMISLGAVKSALDINLALQEWEKVILCYNILQLRHKAQEIIEQELAKAPSPKLWCLLGDATDDPTCYEKAWQLSGGRSARAQRHWAMFHYHRKEYRDSIDHFQLSLGINSLQAALWHALGFAALQEESWAVAAQAYRRYCAIDSECFKAWNNLARCYCELKQTRRAWRALQEAVKLDYSNWRVWENYMLVSLSLKEFEEVVRSYHEVLNLKEKHLDIPVLKSLVVGLCVLTNEKLQIEMPEAWKGDPETPIRSKDELEKLRTNTAALFGRLTSQNLSDPDLWSLYAEIPMSNTVQNLMKKQQLLLKSHRATMNKTSWEKMPDTCRPVVSVLSRLLDVSLELKTDRAVLTSCKMAVTGAVALIKKAQPGTDLCDDLDVKIEQLSQCMNEFN